MKLKILKDKYIPTHVLNGIELKKGKVYEVDKVVVDSYRIKIPMKQKSKFRYALVKEDEGELIDE